MQEEEKFIDDSVMTEAAPTQEVGAEYAFPKDSEILEKCDARIKRMEDHWKPLFRASKDDFSVYNGDQWTREAIGKRGKRVMVTDDFTAPYVEYIVASSFENPSSFKIAAKEATARLKTKALAEALRYYESFGESKAAKSWARECAAVGGFGYYKAVYDLRSVDNGGMPTVGMEQVANPFSILMDENSMKLDGSDAKYLVEYLDTSKERYTYYWRDPDDKSIVLWAEIDKGAVVAKDIYPSTAIPIVPTYARFSNVDGKTVIQGVLRVIKDKQREWNWIKSDALERISTTPTATTYVAAGSLDSKNKKKMAKSFNQPVNFVEVNPITTATEEDKTGTQLIFPARANTAPDLSYVQAQLDQITESVKTSTGIYNTAMGMDATATESGVAIERKTINSNRGVLRYDANAKISDAHMGRILLDLIQNIIAPTGKLPIENEKGERAIILVGKPEVDEMGQPILPRDPKGNVIPFIEDADVTDADISITTQPAYATRKEEGVAKVIDFMGKMDPADQAKLIPQLIEDTDFPGASKYAAILRNEEGNGEVNSAQMQQKIQELEQQIEQGSMQLKEMQNQNMQLGVELKTQSNAMLQKAHMDNQTKLNLKTMDIRSTERTKMYEIQMKNNWHNEDNEIKAAEILADSQQANAQLEADADAQNKEIMSEAVKTINDNTSMGGLIQ